MSPISENQKSEILSLIRKGKLSREEIAAKLEVALFIKKLLHYILKIRVYYYHHENISSGLIEIKVLQGA